MTLKRDLAISVAALFLTLGLTDCATKMPYKQAINKPAKNCIKYSQYEFDGMMGGAHAIFYAGDFRNGNALELIYSDGSSIIYSSGIDLELDYVEKIAKGINEFHSRLLGNTKDIEIVEKAQKEFDAWLDVILAIKRLEAGQSEEQPSK